MLENCFTLYNFLSLTPSFYGHEDCDNNEADGAAFIYVKKLLFYCCLVKLGELKKITNIKIYY